MRFSFLNRKLPPTLSLFIAVVLLWLAFFVVMSPFGMLLPLLLAFASFYLIRPELRAMFGASGDHRPWLVRLREHRWRPIRLPGGVVIPRWAAYAAVLVAWRVIL